MMQEPVEEYYVELLVAEQLGNLDNRFANQMLSGIRQISVKQESCIVENNSTRKRKLNENFVSENPISSTYIKKTKPAFREPLS